MAMIIIMVSIFVYVFSRNIITSYFVGKKVGEFLTKSNEFIDMYSIVSRIVSVSRESKMFWFESSYFKFQIDVSNEKEFSNLMLLYLKELFALYQQFGGSEGAFEYIDYETSEQVLALYRELIHINSILRVKCWKKGILQA